MAPLDVRFVSPELTKREVACSKAVGRRTELLTKTGRHTSFLAREYCNRQCAGLKRAEIRLLFFGKFVAFLFKS